MTAVRAAQLFDAIATAGDPGLDREVRALAHAPAEISREVAAALRAAGVGDRPRITDLIHALALLWHDRLEEAHALVQKRDGDGDADFLHALLHRREGDYGNAKYWWREVGNHPIFPALAAWATGHGLPVVRQDGTFDAGLLVEEVRRACAGTRPPGPLILMQRLEFTALCAHLAGFPGAG